MGYLLTLSSSCYRAKAKQMRADIARKEEENEVIDLLSDSEGEIVVKAVKQTQTKATRKKQVPTIQVNEEVIGEDGQGQF